MLAFLTKKIFSYVFAMETFLAAKLIKIKQMCKPKYYI